jgi:proteic killer suppression protein
MRKNETCRAAKANNQPASANAGAGFFCAELCKLTLDNDKRCFTFLLMIKSIKSKGLRAFWETGSTRRLAVQNSERVAEILVALDDASKPSDMNIPGYVWHSLAPGQPGRYSVRANANYRITFAWDDGAVDVDLEDYH